MMCCTCFVQKFQEKKYECIELLCIAVVRFNMQVKFRFFSIVSKFDGTEPI